MIDLTPVEVRRKTEDFDQGFRGLDPGQVESFLAMVADRLEELQEENRELEREVEHLREQLERFEEREEALNEALLTAQELREEARAQAQREASLTVREAEAEAEAIEKEAERGLDAARDELDDLRSRRAHFLRSFRALLEGYLAEVDVEQERLREADELPPAEEIEGEPDLPGMESRGYAAREESEDGFEPGETGPGALTADAEEPPEAEREDGEDEPGR